jgi:cardiolipin synthase
LKITNFFLGILLLILSPILLADELIIEPDAGRAPLLSAINHANTSIALVMYGMTDTAFTQALIAAKNQGKAVHILLEPTPYKTENENQSTIQQLQAEHIDLQWPDKAFKLTHQKTFLIDQRYAIVMTFNLTHSTFKQQRNFALIINDPAEIHEIQQVFMADCAHQVIAVHQPNLVWSPDNSREKILRLIRSAHTDLMIYAQDISDYQIIGALAKAAHAGINIEVLLPLNAKKYRSKKLAYLKKSGAQIRYSRKYYIHAKVLLIDHQKALIGSINFTKSSLENNRELSVITTDEQVISKLNNTFEQDWNQIRSSAKKRQPTTTLYFIKTINHILSMRG